MNKKKKSWVLSSSKAQLYTQLENDTEKNRTMEIDAFLQWLLT